MIVLDASAVVELLLGSAAGRAVGERIRDPQISLHAPQLVDLEVAQVLRRAALSGNLEDRRAQQALDHLQQLELERYPHPPLMPRIWSLRNNLTAYDAAYVALAEALEAPLLTLDRHLARSSGHTASIEVARGA